MVNLKTRLKKYNVDKNIIKIIVSSNKTNYPGIYQNPKHQFKLDNNKKSIALIIGPSKSGKTTISKFLENFIPRVKTATTRARRPEENGDEYIWIEENKLKNESIEEYAKRIEEKYELIESNYYASNVYGTPKKSIEQALTNNKLCFLVTENNGVRSLNSKIGNLYNILVLFVLPDGLNVIKERIGDRNNIEERLNIAEIEIKDSINITHFFIHNTQYPIYFKNKIIENTQMNVLNFIKEQIAQN